MDDIVREPVAARPPLPLRVASFACERDLPEQVACIRSFLTNAGVPEVFEIVSDGSHSRRSRDLLEAVHPCVVLEDWRSVARPALPRALREYAEANWRGRKLLVLASLPVDRPTLVLDADILFFAAASELRDLARDGGTQPRYLRDSADGLYLDPELLEGDDESEESVNGGFLFLPRPPDWSVPLRRLDERLRSGRATFTAQTVIHLALRRSHARPFDPSRYVLAVDDSEADGDRHVRPDTVLRHYVMPVRHKFWTTLSQAEGGG